MKEIEGQGQTLSRSRALDMGRRVRTCAVTAICAALMLSVTHADATHTAVCDPLPTSAPKVETYSCNPRQNCINNIPGNVQGAARTAAQTACQTHLTSGSCTRTVQANPRQDCLNALPAPATISVSGIDGGSAGGNRVHTATVNSLIIKGRNVAMPGNSVTDEGGGYTVQFAPPTGACAPPDCAVLRVDPSRNIKLGQKSFLIKALHGHSEARGSFVMEASPFSHRSHEIKSRVLDNRGTQTYDSPGRVKIAMYVYGENVKYAEDAYNMSTHTGSAGVVIESNSNALCNGSENCLVLRLTFTMNSQASNKGVCCQKILVKGPHRHRSFEIDYGWDGKYDRDIRTDK